MNDVMQSLGTSAAEGKSTSDLPELHRQADLSAGNSLSRGFASGPGWMLVNLAFCFFLVAVD